MSTPQDPFTPPSGDEPAPSGYGQPPSQPGYGQPQGGQPAFGQQQGGVPYGTPQRAKSNGMGIAALVLGILGLLSFFFFVGGLLGVLAIIFGILGRGKAKRGEADNGGLALAGIILGGLAVLGSIAVAIVVVLVAGSDTFQNLNDCVNAAGNDQAAIDECSRDFQDELTN